MAPLPNGPLSRGTPPPCPPPERIMVLRIQEQYGSTNLMMKKSLFPGNVNLTTLRGLTY